MEARGAPDGERRTITALCADVKGAIDPTADLDPTAASQCIDPALQLMLDAVHRYEGYVVRSLGNGMLALFGAPIVHADHVQRALYAALRIQEELQRYGDTLRLERGMPLQWRLGLHTGEVVVRAVRPDDLHIDYVPIGQATSLAACMQQLATPGSILVTEAIARLAEGVFACKPLGAARVQEVRDPVPIYEVLGPGVWHPRLPATTHQGLTRFVGRQQELAQLQHAWEQAQAGRGQLVAVGGEAGLGKSRLCHEFALHIAPYGTVWETGAVLHGRASPLLPLVTLVQQYFQCAAHDDTQRRRERVLEKVLALDHGLADMLPYFLALLGDPEAVASLVQTDARRQRQCTFEALHRLILQESRHRPLLLLIEDLHWLDSETNAWLQAISERLATLPLLLLVNHRPGYQQAWTGKSYYTPVQLDPLAPVDAEALLTSLIGTGPGLDGLKRLIIAQAEGNPFLLEELVQALVEQGMLVPTPGSREAPFALARPVQALHLPPTVHGVLAARIERLPLAEKALLQTLAVLGNAFPFSLLARIAGQPEEVLCEQLAHLRAAAFIYEQPAFPEPVYTFKHALTLEAAYTSLLQEQSRSLHERVVQALAALSPERVEAHYSALAHYYQRRGHHARAVDYLQRAGQQAVQRAAHADGIAHLSAALEVLQTLPETDERRHQELLLLTTLGPALMATKGEAAPEVAQVYTRAYELGQQAGEGPQLVPVLLGLWGFTAGRAEFRRAQALAEHLLGMGQRRNDPTCLLAGHATTGGTLLFQGDIIHARRHFEQALTAYAPQPCDTLTGVYDIAYGMVSHAWLGLALVLLGYLDQGRQHGAEALRLAQEAGQPYNLAAALGWAGMLCQVRREVLRTLEQAEALVALAAEQGFTLRVAHGALWRGWALAMQGAVETGLAQMRQALVAWRATGAVLGQSWCLGLLAEVCGHAGHVEEGLQVLTEALACVDTTGEHWWEAELWRLKGELLLAQESTGQTAKGKRQKFAAVEMCFQRAIAVARQQQARWPELQATVRLSRLWQHQGKRTAARELLAPVYGWFTEGFDTTDLQEAKALLEALA
jgi:class 3 adenylate cyclase/predicted ATPase